MVFIGGLCIFKPFILVEEFQACIINLAFFDKKRFNISIDKVNTITFA